MNQPTAAGRLHARGRSSDVLRSSVLLVVVVLALALVPRVLDLAVFVGPDEFYWVSGSANFARALADGDLANTYHAGQPGVTLMWIETAGIWVRHAASLLGAGDWNATADAAQTMAVLAVYRTVAAIANAVLVVTMALLVRDVFDYRVAWLSGLFLALDPFLLTESRVVRTEGLMAGITSVALLSLLIYWRQPGVSTVVVSGVLTGLALLSKITAMALLPVGVVLIGFVASTGRLAGRGRWRSTALTLALWAGVVVVTMVVLWPALWVGPADVAGKMLDFTSLRAVEGDDRTKSFLFGISYEDPGWLFYPVVLLYRTSPVMWVGLAALLVGICLGRLAHRDRVAVGAILAYLSVYLLLISISKIKYDRYIVPMLPALLILSAYGLAGSWAWFTARVPSVTRLAAPALAALALLLIALVLPHHPYYYSYYNPLLGGIQAAVEAVPVGTGYEGTEVAASYLNGLPAAGQIQLATAVSGKVRPIFTGRTIAMDNQSGRWFLADYTFIYISQLQRSKHDEQIIAYLQHKPLVHSFQVAGLDYGWIYRGPGAQYYGGDTKLEGRATLHAFDLSAMAVSAGQSLTATVYFRNEGQRAGDRFYVRLVDPDGYVWADGAVRPRLGFELAFGLREAIVEGEATLNLPVGTPPGVYVLKMGYEDEASRRPIGDFVLPPENDDIAVEPAAGVPAPGAFQPPTMADLVVQGEIRLLGYDMPIEHTAAGGSIWLTLYWQALVDVEHDYVIGVQLMNPAGAEAAYWLGRPATNRYPTTGWRAGQPVQDVWQLALPLDLQPADYAVQVSVYDAVTRDRVAVAELGAVVTITGLKD
jgi:hypothetical protein